MSDGWNAYQRAINAWASDLLIWYLYFEQEPIVSLPDRSWYSYVVYPYGYDGLEARLGY